jgi:hypothetical protein
VSEPVRRQVRELVEAFGPPSPGLVARAVAGLPDRRRRPNVRWAAAAAAVLAIAAAGLLVWTARSPGRTVPAGSTSVAALQKRPLVDVPLDAGACQVDPRRARVLLQSGAVTYVGSTSVTVQVVPKAATSSTIGITAGPRVSGTVLVRGHRLDGRGTISFALAPPLGPRRPELALGAGLPARSWDVSIQAGAGGCYALQFDGAGFSEQAVLLLYPSAGATTPDAQTMNPDQARAAVAAAVGRRVPVLLPGVVGGEWRAAVTTAPDGFSVQYSYTDETGARLVVVSAGQPGSTPPGGATRTARGFRGDPRAVYQVDDPANPRSHRALLWQERGVPYELGATDLTDAEFWEVANSLHG